MYVQEKASKYIVQVVLSASQLRLQVVTRNSSWGFVVFNNTLGNKEVCHQSIVNPFKDSFTQNREHFILIGYLNLREYLIISNLFASLPLNSTLSPTICCVTFLRYVVNSN